MKGSTSIIIYGKAGDGIRFFSKKLIFLINETFKEKHITYFYDYDATVKNGKSIAYITISDDIKKQQLMFMKCDILISFDGVYPNELVADKSITTIKYDTERYTFNSLALAKFKKKLYGNMIALGYLINYLELNIEMDFLSGYNKEAIFLGHMISREAMQCFKSKQSKVKELDKRTNKYVSILT